MIRNDLDTLNNLAQNAFKKVDPYALAFLFASGKSEGFLRDQLGIFMELNLGLSGDEHVTREWKKHDLAVMDGNQPLILIEGKSWICHDAYRKSKLLTDKKSIFQGALKDSKKLIETKKRYANTSIYISTIIYGVNTSSRSSFDRFNVTYGDSHDKGIVSAGNFSNLVGISRSHATALHSAFGTTRRFPLQVGSYHGMEIEADFFLTHIERTSAKEVEREIRNAILE